jgi:ribosomal protein S27AE
MKRSLLPKVRRVKLKRVPRIDSDAVRCPRCRGSILASYGVRSCINCGYEPPDGVTLE